MVLLGHLHNHTNGQLSYLSTGGEIHRDGLQGREVGGGGGGGGLSLSINSVRLPLLTQQVKQMF